jgi:hypothetical protein
MRARIRASIGKCVMCVVCVMPGTRCGPRSPLRGKYRSQRDCAAPRPGGAKLDDLIAPHCISCRKSTAVCRAYR